MGQLRTRKDGGCSYCNASDENVGKRRCCHVLDGASMEVRCEKGMKFVDISGSIDGKDTSFSIPSTTKEIKGYIESLGSCLPKKTRESLYNKVRNMP